MRRIRAAASSKASIRARRVDAPFPFDLTDDATSDLEEIVAYIALDNQRAALKIADDLEATFRFLADWPLAGHISARPDLRFRRYLRFWPNGRYLIVYSPATTPDSHSGRLFMDQETSKRFFPIAVSELL